MSKKAPTQVPWSKTELATLRKEFPHMSTAAVAKMLSRPIEATKKKAHRLGLKKTRAYRKTLGWKK